MSNMFQGSPAESEQNIELPLYEVLKIDDL